MYCGHLNMSRPCATNSPNGSGWPTSTSMLLWDPRPLGIVLAYEMGRQLNRPAAYAEKGNGHARILRRPDHLPASSRVLIVDDVLTTGGSVRECMDLVERCGATVAGVAVLVDRAGGSIEFGAPLVSTLSLNVESWDAAEVPASLAAIPITRPGSTGKK